MNSQDPRIQELLDLAREEGIKLPYPIDLILWLEDRGRVVNLHDGSVTLAYDSLAMPTPSGVAVTHLLHDAMGAAAL
jgi:hypothetical protein